jgi:hypothetical protein
MPAMKRHRFDPLSFLFGVVFLLVGVTFLFGGGLDQVKPSAFWPATMVVVGLTLAAWVVATALRRPKPAKVVVVDDQESDDRGEAEQSPETDADKARSSTN